MIIYDIFMIGGTVLCTFSIIFSVKTIIDTRKKYYDDYIRRKRDGQH